MQIDYTSFEYFGKGTFACYDSVVELWVAEA